MAEVAKENQETAHDAIPEIKQDPYVRAFRDLPAAYIDPNKHTACFIGRIKLNELISDKMVRQTSETRHSTKFEFTKKGKSWVPDKENDVTELDF